MSSFKDCRHPLAKGTRRVWNEENTREERKSKISAKYPALHISYWIFNFLTEKFLSTVSELLGLRTQNRRNRKWSDLKPTISNLPQVAVWDPVAGTCGSFCKGRGVHALCPSAVLSWPNLKRPFEVCVCVCAWVFVLQERWAREGRWFAWCFSILSLVSKKWGSGSFYWVATFLRATVLPEIRSYCATGLNSWEDNSVKTWNHFESEHP